MRRITSDALEALKFYEQGPYGGPALTAYLCPAGVWTVGYGETGPDIGPGTTIKAHEAEPRLLKKLHPFCSAVEQACSISPNDNQFSAMVLLAYNIGIGAFRKSTVLRMHNAGQQAKAAEAFLMWNKATGSDGVKRELRGLTLRRSEEAAMYLQPTEEQQILDPARTRASDIEASPVAGDSGIGTGRIVAVGAAVSSAATAASQVVGQVEPVWNGLQRAAGPATPHILMGLIGLVAVLAVCATVYLVARQRRSVG